MTTTTLHISTLDTVRHYTNPLHIWARLMKLGMSKEGAKRIVVVYEPLFRALLG